MVFDARGPCVAAASRPLKVRYPHPGWVEQNPGEIWKTVYLSVQEVLEKIDKKGQVVAIGITNQRETALLWDAKTGRSVGPAIVWQCRRTADLCEKWKRIYGEKFFHGKTGLVVDPYFSASKIVWMFHQNQDLRHRAARGEILFGTVDSWILWKLTGGHVHATDQTNASRTLLLNLQKASWDPEILDALKIPLNMLPHVKESISHFGKTTRLGVLPSGIPITGIAGDQQAALFGQACFKSGMVKNTYGTGCFMLWALGEKRILSRHGLLTTRACFGKSQMGYALEGSVFVAGSAIQWLRDEMNFIHRSSDCEKWALGLKDNGGVYLVPAFTGLGSPYWDPHARGAIFGLTRGTRKAHLVRAALEAIAYQTRDVLEALEKEVKCPIRELRVDGGACKNNFLMQFQSDILNCEVNRPDQIETTAQGVAWMAGLGVGLWKNTDEVARLRKTDVKFSPMMKSAERKKLYRGWKMAVSKVMTHTNPL
ncbi:MAG: glycerol kinase GlpK [Chlamydiae bacterium]|nr:glycerol kinase GlpK [Chlamydiota bacterium]MBI3266669.1 glycerol kinase GlpK [Chlamydiota bacterium]